MAFNVEVKEQMSKAPAGQYQAVCCELLDLGWNDRTYKNKDTGLNETRKNHEVQYVFQLNKVDENGKRYEIRSQPFNLILSEKASLRKFLTMWRGHDLLPDELKPPGVNIELIGRNALIQVVHNPQGDKVYANISSIMPLMEGMLKIEALDYKSRQEAVTKAAAEKLQQTSQPMPPPSTDSVMPDGTPIPF